MLKRRTITFCAFAVFLLSGFICETSNTFGEPPKGPCAAPPRAKPHRRKAAESFAPLPLPVTPLRRTEKKRPPAPPALIAKIRFGPKRVASLDDGRSFNYWDWNKDPADIQGLLTSANSRLGVNYGHQKRRLRDLSTNPAEMPIFYFTGSEDFTFSQGEADKLRTFVLRGGTIWGETCYGDPAFFKAFIREMRNVFPDRQLRRLPLHHPVFNCFYKIDKVDYTEKFEDCPNGEPYLMGLDVGCRTAVFLSKYDLSCGWDGHIRRNAWSVKPESATRLGVNMIAYTLAYHKLGKFLSTTKVFYEEGERARGDFVFGQIVHSGNWDPHPSAVANLLKEVAVNTSSEVKFQRRKVDLIKSDIFAYPFLYITGHDAFEFGEKEVIRLQSYLNNGGFLLADSCCGSPEFDAAFRREIKKVLPDVGLQKLPANHPVYSALYKIGVVKFAEYVRKTQPGLNEPSLEGITLGGSTVVIYSPYDLGCGWQNEEHPFCKGIAAIDSLKLGINVVVYSMTH